MQVFKKKCKGIIDNKNNYNDNSNDNNNRAVDETVYSFQRIYIHVANSFTMI